MKLNNILQTCFSAPCQWNAKDDNGRNLYIRYRHSEFTIDVVEGWESPYRYIGKPKQIYYQYLETKDDHLEEEEMIELVSFIEGEQ